MDMLAPRDALIPFEAPEAHLAGLDAEALERLIVTASDVALVIDEGGVIRDLAFGGAGFTGDDCRIRRGRAWRDTVTEETRPKIDALLEAARADGAPRWRQVNHVAADGSSVPVLYSVVRLGAAPAEASRAPTGSPAADPLEHALEQPAADASDRPSGGETGPTAPTAPTAPAAPAGARLVAVGRDLRSVATLQRRLVEAQQSMERDYARLRHAETRYRLLFQNSAEAVAIVDAESRRVVEANAAALALFGDSARGATRRSFLDLFEPEDAPRVEALISAVRASGRADAARARLAGGGPERPVAATLFRQEGAALLLVRLGQEAPGLGSDERLATLSNLSKLIESAPDAVVLTDLSGAVLFANAAFLDMAQIAAEGQAIGQSVDRWLGRPGIDFDVLAGNLRAHGSVRSYDTILRDGLGGSEEVAVSAVAVLDGAPPCFGFVLRLGAKPGWAEGRAAEKLPRSVEQLTQLIGRVPLRDIVRETTDVIERLCIEAALELTGDNRASAAELLGLSRQSLYVKLRRYGLGDLDGDPEE